jgi:TPR repeat protein
MDLPPPSGVNGDGRGVERDDVRAYMWFSLGAEAGNAGAAKGRELVAERITPRQVADAQKMAAECRQRSFKGCD